MTQKETVKNMVRRIIHGAGITNSTGLYNGKAGLSLSLFSVADYLEDEHIGDAAYNLFQESLITMTIDTGFENGLSGIGYVMLYLAGKKYIRVDFSEIFSKEYEAVINNLEHIVKASSNLISSSRTIYFLSKVKTVKKDDKRLDKIITDFFDCIELFLTVQFHDIADINYIHGKIEILDIYTTYLKLVDFSGYTHFSHSLAEQYAALYRTRRIAGSLETGYYLGRIMDKNGISEYEDVVSGNINSGVKNILISPLSLRERIDYARIIDVLKPEGIDTGRLLPDIKDLNIEKVVQDLMKRGGEGFFPFGYGAGLGRLLVHYTNKQTELL